MAFWPVLVNLYFATTSLSCGFELKVCSVVSQANWPKAEPATKQSRNSNTFIGELSI